MDNKNTSIESKSPKMEGEDSETRERNKFLTRRKFLGLMSSLLSLFGLGAVLSAFIAYLRPPRSTIKKVGGWQVVGTLSEFKQVRSLSRTYFGLPIILVKGSKELHSFCLICPHLGCIVKWDEAKKRFSCPCHDSDFDSDGKALRGPAMPYKLLPFDIMVEGEAISVKLPEDKLRGYPSWFKNTMISGA